MCMLNFTVLMSVYRNDKPHDFEVSIDSVMKNQTVLPKALVLIVDGPVPLDLELSIREKTKNLLNTNVVWLPENKGLGNALRLGVELCETPLIARMDSDDIAVFDRFEKQLCAFENDATLSIIGGTINEFIDQPNNIVGKRTVPCADVDIKNYMKHRCAFNHMTVMFRKSEVMRVGNYRTWHWNEDYYLWIRMLMGGCKFANLEDVLVNVRVGRDMYARRGGWKYFKSEVGIHQFLLNGGIISTFQYVKNIFIRFVLQVLMPNRMREWVFCTFARDKVEK